MFEALPLRLRARRELSRGDASDGEWLTEFAHQPDELRRLVELVPHGPEIATRVVLALDASVASFDERVGWAETVARALEPFHAAVYGGHADTSAVRHEVDIPDDAKVAISLEVEDALDSALRDDDAIGPWVGALYEPLWQLLHATPMALWYALCPYVRTLEDPRLRQVADALDEWPAAHRARLHVVRSVKLGRWVSLSERAPAPRG